MAKNFNYFLPVNLHFGVGICEKIDEIIKEHNFSRGLLICDKLFIQNGVAEKIKSSTSSIYAIFSDITPNPLLSEVEKAAKTLIGIEADFVIALGGGSSLDLAKFACSMVFAKFSATEYFYKRQTFTDEHLPLIAIPTTAGTGSEVTAVSVCNDDTTGNKAPLYHNNFFPYIAIVDPTLTKTVPPFITAVTGFDAMSHALEAFWSVNHQPICDMYAKESLRLIFASLEKAYDDGDCIEARSNMSLGSLYAGLAFAQAKTAAVHACSYPLSVDYNLCHGEACAFTLDLFLIENAKVDTRLITLAKDLGFASIAAMVNEMIRLKKKFKLKTTFADLGKEDIETLSENCVKHPLFNNNPRKYTQKELIKVFERLK
jgi:alcohol dehydrogenase